jgi:hypothetical protein
MAREQAKYERIETSQKNRGRAKLTQPKRLLRPLFPRERGDSLRAMSDGGPAKPTNAPAAGASNPYAPPAASIDLGGPPAVTGGGFKSALPLANAVVVAMALYVLAEVMVSIDAFVAIGVMKGVLNGEPFDQAPWAAIDARARMLGVLLEVVWLAGIVTFCVFMPRANKNARAFMAPLSNTPGWAAGWFFVPIVYLWKPYYAMKEIWQGSDPDPSVDAYNARVSPLLPLWWWMYLAFFASRGLFSAANKDTPGRESFIAMEKVRIAISVITILAAFLAAAVVRRLALRQEERQRRLTATASAAP